MGDREGPGPIVAAFWIAVFFCAGLSLAWFVSWSDLGQRVIDSHTETAVERGTE